NLTFGPDPATHNHCTLGGMLGNNSCGVHSIMAGTTADNVESLDILTYDGLRLTVGPTSDDELAKIIQAGGRRGDIYRKLRDLRDRYGDQVRRRFPKIPRRISGYNLPELLPEHGFNVARALVGSEGTCVTILEATLRLVPSPQFRALAVLGYPDIATGCDHIPELMKHQPVGLEGFDAGLINDMRKKQMHAQARSKLPEGEGWLLVEFGGDSQDEANDKAQKLVDDLKKQKDHPDAKVVSDPAEQQQIWLVRESAVGAASSPVGEKPVWPGWDDAAVPPDRLGDYLRDITEITKRHGLRADLFGHFGQGCVHARYDFDLMTAAGIENFRSFISDASDLVVKYGGSLSGEHGDGQARAEFLPRMYGDELVGAFKEFKAIWDPQNMMNPGRIVDADPIDANLRLGTSYSPPELDTHFSFPSDGGSFANATLRCVGVGKCRRHEGGTMCPSYMVTREEEHSTRGRARLLFEMLNGAELDGWRDDHVHEALDLCLACKGCKGDCPVQVDMATYKAEFLSHYYEHRLRPRHAYAFGLIHWWAWFASLAPGLVNQVSQSPRLSPLVKRISGMAPERQVPQFAGETFRHWFARREPHNQDKPKVILWADTFNDNFHPDTAKAAVEVLESAGYQVVVPEGKLCCGRPLYDYGMLDLAEHLLHDILRTLKPEIEAGVPLIGLEPSCLAVFRDELVNLFPHDEDAQRLSSQSYLLSEFLVKHRDDIALPTLKRKALVHGHCHHKAIMGMDAEEAILSKLGLDYQLLDDGCCGMAGAFGFESGDHYDVSVKAGERVLLPAVRAASDDTLIIANGYSCREQIEQLTDRKALHLAQVLRMAMHDGPNGPAGELPEQAGIMLDGSAPAMTHVGVKESLVGAGAAAAVVAGAVVWKRRH
ncbi:MAG TPA: FAD-linked oxidase C-terminal domain-containing protein, partial [Thermomicrobiaceae bacterium]|nr:FAD-linked oxidase C-terminal domain-containing protein [Thermomicrobiaceae bacterium]